jgi:hypothetical protein
MVPLPPEEFVISRDARTLEDATLVSHRTYKRAGDLIADGFDPDVVESLPDYGTSDLALSGERLGRKPWDRRGTENTIDPMMRQIAVHEGKVKCDYDGSGLKYWYFVAAGSEKTTEILKVEPYKCQIDFADFCPNPLPHTFWGRCPADELVQIQRITSTLSRQVLDNIYLSNTPQREVVVSQILDQRLEYVQNQVPGGIVPVTKMGAVREIAVPFVAEKGILLQQFWQDRAESRTGVSRNSAGLDADKLQNQAPTVALLNDNNAKIKVEMVARIWAAGGMRKLFRGVLKMLKTYQTYDRMVRMGGKMVKVSPQEWDQFEDWDVTINTGMGTGSRERDIQMGAMVLQKQEQILQTMGPSNPMVTIGMYAHNFRKVAEVAGFNPDTVANDIPMDWAPPPGPQQPDPVIVKAKMDNDTKMQTAFINAQVKREENATNVQLRLREQDIEATLGKYQIDKKASTDQASNIARK